MITAQYFVWFFCLLPLILPWSKMKLKWGGLSCILLWIGAQTHWLLWGYLLEFKGKNVFLQLWAAGLLFLAANIFILVMIIRQHNCSSVFKALENTHSKHVTKLEWVTLVCEWVSIFILTIAMYRPDTQQFWKVKNAWSRLQQLIYWWNWCCFLKVNSEQIIVLWLFCNP